MHRLPKTGEYKYTLPKSEHESIFRILSSLGSFEAARDFTRDIDSLFVYDKTYGISRSPTDSLQKEIFAEIIKQANTLLKVLQPIRRDENDICVDAHTATLIYMSRSILVQEKLQSLNEKKGEESVQIADGGIVDFRYPMQLITSLDEMRDAVIHAAKSVKPKRGNSPKRTTEAIRKRNLANSFVSCYQIRYKKLPPISVDGKVTQVFILLLKNAGLSKSDESEDFSCLRMAIERAKRDKTLTVV